MLQKTKRVLVLLAVLALTSGVEAVKKATAVTNSSYDLGDGTSVETKENSTIFLGTEYNPNKCILQYGSIGCNAKKNDCGELNSFPLECNKLGLQDGVDKYQCRCRDNETDYCQVQNRNETADLKPGIPQFGDCSKDACMDSYGHVATKDDNKVCAEKIHCVTEVNTTGTPSSVCHTCRSCIAQNDPTDTKLTDLRRFNCTAICPPAVLSTLTKRNQEGVGIADAYSSNSDSGSNSGSEESSSQAYDAAGSSAKPAASAAPSAITVSVSTLVGSIVAASLSLALVL